jgi:glycosyltransferase involved in cell wall biosynthesis
MDQNQEERSKKIYIFSWGYPSNSTKGNPFIEDAVHLAHENGIDTTVINFQFKNILEYFFPYKKHLTYTSKRGEKMKILSIFNVPFVSSSIRKKIILWQVESQIKKWINKEGKPDLLQQHYIFHSSPFIVDFIARKFNIPYVLFEHSPIYSAEHFEKKFNTFCHPYFSRKEFENFISKAQDLFAYKVQIDTLSRYFHRQFRPFDGFLPNYLLDSKASENEIPMRKRFTFCCIGTLDDRKGTLRLIEAFSKIKMLPECELIFCGSGPFLEKAQNLIADYSLKNQVTITGFIPRSQVISYLRSSDFVVIASSYETFGMTCIEAMAYGVPVVSTKCGGPETIINDHVGILCENNNIPSLADALEKAFQAKSEFSSDLIKKYFQENYSEENAWKNLKRIYGLD